MVKILVLYVCSCDFLMFLRNIYVTFKMQYHELVTISSWNQTYLVLTPHWITIYRVSQQYGKG